MNAYKMWIDGKWVDAQSQKTYRIINPATEEEIAQVPLGGKEDIDNAVKAARKAFPAWSGKTPAERSRILSRISTAIGEHAQELVGLDILEHGSPVWLANMLFQGSPQHFEYAAQVSRSFMGDVIPVNSGIFHYLRREPVGVCGIITPWNVPLVALTTKLSSALAVGNTCVVKPASITPLTTLKIAEVLAKLDLPPGVVNVITGPGSSIGQAIASHPGVDMISFTGSCETGKAIMSAASQTVKRLALELGGKNPFIVLEDADIDAAVEIGVETSFRNTGQICSSPGRYYIHEKLYDDFVEKFVACARKVTVGDPTDPNTRVGPVVSAEHRKKIEEYIDIGLKDGAKLVLGGKRPTQPPLNKGYFVMPTVFSNVTHNMRIAREEIFGPVVSLLKFSSEDQVLALANDSVFGLCASVWTKDAPKAIRFANQIRAGAIWINDHMVSGAELPWGGFKESGFGKERSVLGLEEYTQVKTISLSLAERKK